MGQKAAKNLIVCLFEHVFGVLGKLDPSSQTPQFGPLVSDPANWTPYFQEPNFNLFIKFNSFYRNENLRPKFN